jgi:iron uptake system EfeUOB component EfeO/EfeM
VEGEQEVRQVVSTASHDSVTMPGGATDLVNEAVTSKITGHRPSRRL